MRHRHLFIFAVAFTALLLRSLFPSTGSVAIKISAQEPSTNSLYQSSRENHGTMTTVQAVASVMERNTSNLVPAASVDPGIRALLKDAIQWNAAVIQQHNEGAAASAIPKGEVNDNWEIAEELVAAVLQKRRPRLKLLPNAASGSSSVKGIDHSHEDHRTIPNSSITTPQPHLLPKHRNVCDPTSHQCVSALAATVPVWDSHRNSYVAPTTMQVPVGQGHRLSGDRKNAAASILEVLTKMAAPTDRAEDLSSTTRAQQTETQQQYLQRILAQGSSLEAAAEQRRQYALRVLAPRTKAHAYRGCLGPGKCEDESGPCEWCGTRVCCFAGALDDSALCGGHGGRWRHVCTSAPAGVAVQMLDALLNLSWRVKPSTKLVQTMSSPSTLPKGRFRLVTGARVARLKITT